MAVALALLVIGGGFVPWLLGFQRLAGGAEPSFLLSLIAYPAVLVLLAWFTIGKMREGSLPAMKVGE
jgi:fucose permease